MFTLVLIVAALAVAAVGALPENPTIMFNENQGIIGARLRSAGLATSTVRDYAAFWGVPFADAPVGKLRFKPPQPKDLPEGVFSAADVSAAVGCIQQSRAPLRISGQEDCLTLQIFTPNYDYPTLPVIVNIHGGAFMFGRPISNGLQYIMDHDVVFVTITYRLGILGFMSFEDDELRGNIGMLDQVEALKWVQRNIHHFGGNNESVTLVSNSAGSVSNILHTMSPLSKGLIHRVIGSSGSPVNPWARQFSAREKANLIAKTTGCDAPTTAEKIRCLQDVKAADLVALQGQLFQFWLDHPWSPFVPVVDGVFLTKDPAELAGDKTAVMDVPLLMSFVPEEGLFTAGEFILNDSLLMELDDQWLTVAPQILHFNDSRISDQDRPLAAQKIREKYIGDRSLAEAKRELIKLITDRSFLCGVSSYISKRAKTQTSPIYVSEMTYRGEYSLYPGGMGVSHADDFAFAIENPGRVLHRSDDWLMRKNLIGSWVAFAKTSKPSIPDVEWWPVNGNNDEGVIDFLRIAGPYASDMHMTSEKDLGNETFWRDLQIESAIQPNRSGRFDSSLTLCFGLVGALFVGSQR